MAPILRWLPGVSGGVRSTLKWWVDHTFTFCVCLAVFYSVLIALQPRFLPPQLWLGDTEWRLKPERVHPITNLIKDFETKWLGVTDSGANNTITAAYHYRQRRGREPPPGFDVWAEKALASNSVIIERFFDRIYKDLGPFWSIEPGHLRFQVYSQPNVIRIRDGHVYHFSNDEDVHGWVETWAKFLREFAKNLPDVDIPVNVMNTPRLAVDKEDINTAMDAELATRKTIRPPHDAITAFSGLEDSPPVDPATIKSNFTYTHNWQTTGFSGDPKAYWLQYRRTCPLDNPSREMWLNKRENIRGNFPREPNPGYTNHGYISDVNAARNPCNQPYIRGMYGLFVNCGNVSTSDALMPIFSGSKLPGNNDILLPSPSYLSTHPTDALDTSPWHSKGDRLYWRGGATGGVTGWDT
jgi:hypothetical protein